MTPEYKNAPAQQIQHATAHSTFKVHTGSTALYGVYALMPDAHADFYTIRFHTTSAKNTQQITTLQQQTVTQGPCPDFQGLPPLISLLRLICWAEAQRLCRESAPSEPPAKQWHTGSQTRRWPGQAGRAASGRNSAPDGAAPPAFRVEDKGQHLHISLGGEWAPSPAPATRRRGRGGERGGVGEGN